MELEQIRKTLEDRFAESLPSEQKRRLIFWYDTEQQFADLIEQLELKNARVHRLTDNNHFHTKYRLEVEYPDTNYLVYAVERPDDEHNWLLDSLLYSSEFHADRVLLYMEELGINPSLKFLVKRCEKFFANANRRRKLASYNIASYDEASLEIAMMSSLCGLKFADGQGVFKKVLGDAMESGANRPLGEITKFLGSGVFWKHARRYFGYSAPEPTLIQLAAYILVNSLRRTLTDEQLLPLKEYLAGTGPENCIYFVDQWMNHKTDATAFEELARMVAKYLNIDERLAGIPVEDLAECDSFEWFDKQIIRYMVDSVTDQVANHDFCLELIKARRTRHWYEKYLHIYESLFHVFKLLQFNQAHPTIPKLGAPKIWDNYTSQYCLVDYYYRKFYWYYDQQPVEILKPIQDMVENLYSNWFLDSLGTAWSSSLAGEAEGHWRIPGVKGQQEFYKNHVDKVVGSGHRCFVIISDALRYEVGLEITERLNAEKGGKAAIQSMLGVLPSTTRYGMAALLPHQQLSLNDKGQVMADGMKTDSLAERDAVLKTKWAESLAIDYHSIIAATQDERREMVKGRKMVYIYHNCIDAVGDKAATEIKVFDAAHQAIEEILRLVRIIRDDLSGVNIFITADHGFIYKRDPLLESDKIKKETVGAFEEKRRYMLGYQEKEAGGLMTFKPKYLHSDEGPLVVYVPKGTIRFKVPGPGANYVHGGAALQEVVVPLINFRVVRGSQAKKIKEHKVKVKLVNESRKITNSLFTLEFFQTEKVGGGYIPCTVDIYLTDEEGQVLSNQETIIADRQSDKPDERTFKLKLTLKTGNYDKNKDYYLIIKDTETKLNEGKIPFKINLAISSDFDF